MNPTGETIMILWVHLCDVR